MGGEVETVLSPFDVRIRTAAENHLIPLPAFQALLEIESDFRTMPTPRWEAHRQEHSYGLGQLLPSTALWIGCINPRVQHYTRKALADAMSGMVSDGEKALNDALHRPIVNLDLAAAYYEYQYDRYGKDKVLAAAAYNAGSVRRTPVGTLINEHYATKFKTALAKYEAQMSLFATEVLEV